MPGCGIAHRLGLAVPGVVLALSLSPVDACSWHIIKQLLAEWSPVLLLLSSPPAVPM